MDLRNELNFLREQSLHRKLITVETQGPIAKVKGKDVILMCSNDYLGISQNKQVIRALYSALKNGISQCSSRLVSGNDHMLEELENSLAKQKRRGGALVYPTGYMTNIGVISSLAGKEDLIVSDELNHASIVDACNISRADVKVFKHNNVEDLQSKLSTGDKRHKLVVTEGVFSMDGDFAKLKEMGKVSHENNALFVVDDAHGDFIYGTHFRGTAEYLHAERYVDAMISSMSKGLGCFGGYVVGDKDLVEYLINRSRQFIYTSALPSIFASASIVALKICVNGSLQKKLWTNVRNFQKGLVDMGLNVNSSSHIIPIMIGDEKTAMIFSRMLLRDGVFAQAIRYPTVRKGTARIRISMTSLLGDYIDDALLAFSKSARKLSLI
ncbi:MAG: aminotransferase class I/II-fold pyridoxal phosphate-dependent enzyme [Nitrososphaerales archaeon]